MVTGLDDMIAAISTPPGEGGIGIVRLSGPGSIEIVHRIFASSSGRDMSRSPHRVFHGEIRDRDEALDEVLIHVMRAPHSYTREDVVEINCHGGAVPLNAVLELVLQQGARLAEPGEFTKRAFLNGRIDLVQAEAVIDRIRSRTRAGLKAADAAASGVLSTEIHVLCEALRAPKSRIEAAIDFPDDDLPELINPELRANLEQTLESMRRLLATADAGRLYREGAAVTIAGRPNVGKSSLFNALLRDTRAIVTAQEGTTRDLLEDLVTIEGIPVRLRDTAGLRDAVGEVERIGVEVARRALEEAAAVIFVVDVSQALTDADQELAQDIVSLEVPALLALNKIDRAAGVVRPDFADDFYAVVQVSATVGTGMSELEETLGRALLGGSAVEPDRGMITRLHQKDSLRRAIVALERLIENFGASPEFLALDLDESLRCLGEITGETTPDEVLEQIFSSFCIGK